MCYKVLTCNICDNTNCGWIDYCKLFSSTKVVEMYSLTVVHKDHSMFK